MQWAFPFRHYTTKNLPKKFSYCQRFSVTSLSCHSSSEGCLTRWISVQMFAVWMKKITKSNCHTSGRQAAATCSHTRLSNAFSVLSHPLGSLTNAKVPFSLLQNERFREIQTGHKQSYVFTHCSTLTCWHFVILGTILGWAVALIVSYWSR